MNSFFKLTELARQQQHHLVRRCSLTTYSYTSIRRLIQFVRIHVKVRSTPVPGVCAATTILGQFWMRALEIRWSGLSACERLMMYKKYAGYPWAVAMLA
jgi:hypothetical protein